MTKISRLTVIEKIGGRYRFRCDCGRIIEHKASKVVSGSIKSCGCLRKQRAADMGKKWGKITGGKHQKSIGPGLDSAHRLRVNYARDAHRRGIAFNLSKDDFVQITGSLCYYCGTPPSSVMKGRQKHLVSDYVYNGVDRVNNLQGYEIGNCVACCKWCNRAKCDRPVNEFLSWARRIAQRYTK